MKNYVQPGKQLNFVAAADLLSGDVAIVGEFVGVVAADALTGADAVMSVEGVFELPPAAASVAGLTNGAKAYWDAGAGEVTDVNTDVAMGWVFGSDAVTGSVNVKLAPTSAAA